MFAVLVTGLALWFTYGLMIGALPIILANGTTSLLASTILVFKIKQLNGKDNKSNEQ
jgi:MtN3 and saliva related transmembrane protein